MEGGEGPREKEVAESGEADPALHDGSQPSLWGHKVGHSLALSFLGEGNGNPLQYSCLENPMDGGACRAAVHGVVKSLT